MKKVLLVIMLFVLSSVGFSEITKEKEVSNFHQTEVIHFDVVLNTTINEFNSLFEKDQKEFKVLEYGCGLLPESQYVNRHQTPLRYSIVSQSPIANILINQPKTKMKKLDIKLTKDFWLSEFACKDGTPVPLVLMPNVRLLATNLQVIRDTVNEPIYLNSAYRHPSYNKAVGGAEDSRHLYAEAGDLRAKTLSPDKLSGVIKELIADGKIHDGGLGLYNSFTHYDVRPKPARWDERNKA
jgi:hypothetical protein